MIKILFMKVSLANALTIRHESGLFYIVHEIIFHTCWGIFVTQRQEESSLAKPRSFKLAKNDVRRACYNRCVLLFC